MTEIQLETQRDLTQAAKERLSRWVLSPELREFMEQSRDPVARRELKFGPFITISREMGAGGSEAARFVGQMLNWDVLDKELLDFMADRYNLPRDMLEFVDEKHANWLQGMLGAWLNPQRVSHESYVMHLQRILLLAALHGRVVIVGRGAACVLPRHTGLAARLTAPEAQRVRRVMAKYKVESDAARELIRKTDQNRANFCRFFFNCDSTDPHLYDLVLNTERFTAHAAAELIVSAYKSRRGHAA